MIDYASDKFYLNQRLNLPFMKNRKKKKNFTNEYIPKLLLISNDTPNSLLSPTLWMGYLSNKKVHSSSV